MPSNVDVIEMITTVLARELHKQTIQDQIIRPLLKWLFWHITPYVLGMIVLNFFITVCAVSLVLYFRR